MDVRKRLRLFSRLKKWFPLLALRLQARVIEHAFDSELDEATEKQDWTSHEELLHRRYFEASEYLDEISAIRTRRLIAKARRLYAPLDDLIWETGHFGQRFLTPASEAKLFNALKVARRDNWELWVKIILALSGLVGALTGMLAVWKK